MPFDDTPQQQLAAAQRHIAQLEGTAARTESAVTELHAGVQEREALIAQLRAEVKELGQRPTMPSLLQPQRQTAPEPLPAPVIATSVQAVDDTDRVWLGDVILAELKIEDAIGEKDDTLRSLIAIRQKIRSWVTEFEEREGRKPEKTDKKAIRDDFVLLRELEQKVEVRYASAQLCVPFVTV